jgi:hypothetical protein
LVMRFAQGLGYDGFTAVQSALREELTAVEGGRWGVSAGDIEHGSNSELLLRRARQVSDLALTHRICVAAVPDAADPSACHPHAGCANMGRSERRSGGGYSSC